MGVIVISIDVKHVSGIRFTESIEISMMASSSEAVVQSCSLKKVLLEVSQNSQENTCARASFLIKLQAWALAQLFSSEFCELSKSSFFHRTPLVAASTLLLVKLP